MTRYLYGTCFGSVRYLFGLVYGIFVVIGLAWYRYGVGSRMVLTCYWSGIGLVWHGVVLVW